MLTLSGVCIFIERCAVKSCKTVLVFGEMSKHPVKNHADSCSVTAVNKFHKVVGSAKS